jgi:hypothetical protein
LQPVSVFLSSTSKPKSFVTFTSVKIIVCDMQPRSLMRSHKSIFVSGLIP